MLKSLTFAVVCALLYSLSPVATNGALPSTPLADNERTEILVLGMAHLSALKDSFDESMLSDLLAILENFQPDAIAVEQLPPARIAELANAAATNPSGPAVQLVAAFCDRAVTLGADALWQ